MREKAYFIATDAIATPHQAHKLMLMSRLRPGFCLLLLILLPAIAEAWGQLGHRVVGELAEHQLSTAARVEVGRLLAGEPEPTLAGVAYWADELRSTQTDLARRSSHWHYLNFPRGDCHYVPPRDCPDGQCVVAAINRNFLALSDHRRPDAERAEALKFLVHFVADVHQPLHAGFGDDRGGNDYQLYFHGKASNLHSVWDSAVIEQRHLPASEYAQALSRLPPLAFDPTRRSDRPAVEWAQESCRIVAAPDFYPAKGRLGNVYLKRNQAIAERRLRQAGARLADMINYALDPKRGGSR